MPVRLTLCGLTGCVWICCLAAPCLAVIKADLPLSKVYRDSDEIVIAKVLSVDAEKNAVQLHEAVGFSELNKYLRRKDRSLLLHLGGDKTLAKELRPGDPVVLFLAKPAGAAHLANRWFSAMPAEGANWSLGEQRNLGRTFPGSTPSLIRALMLLRAEKAPILDNIEHSTFGKGYKLQRLDAVGTAMASGDATGDRRPALVVAGEQGVRFYQGPGEGKPFVEATRAAGLDSATARQVAFADVDGDGKADLLLDELYLNQGGKFVRSQAGIDLKSRDLLAVALVDATGDGRPDALALSPSGELVTYENPGQPGPWTKRPEATVWKEGEPRWAAHIAAWGDDGRPHVMAIERTGPVRYSLAGEAADFKRLTGEEEPLYRGKPRHFPIDDYAASAAWDRLGGDGYPDLLISTKRGGLADLELIGRGHGAFFYNKEGKLAIAVEGQRREHRPQPVALAPCDIDGNGTLEMVFLEASGDLWVNHSPFFVAGAPIDAPKK